MIGFLASLTLLNAQAAVVWDGNGTPNASGTWETANNWNPDGIPGVSSSVQLNDVTSGTRIITISSGSPQTIAQLAITQATVGAINRLDINDNLTVAGGSSAPLSFTIANPAGVVINVATGKTFSASRTSSATSAFGGTLNLLGTGSTFSQTSAGAMTASFSGPIQAAAGSSLAVSGTSASLSLSGTSSFGTGSNILLQYSTTGGAANFTNSGTLTMDGAILTFDWSATAVTGGNTVRNYSNSGNWTLKNGASVILISTGNMQTGGGFSNLVNNANTGTLNLESGSTLTNRSFFNTGTLNLGSSTAGGSDATVVFGGEITNDMYLNNGFTAASVASIGTINVNGNTIFGRATPAASTSAILNNGSASATGSTLNVGDGTVAATLTISNTHATLNNFEGNSVNIRSGGTLLLGSVATGSTLGNAVFSNSGSLTQSGSLQFRSNNSATSTLGQRTFSNTGTHAISGTAATIESLTNSGTGGSGIAAAINYTNSGRLSGATANDKLTYTNTSGTAAVNTLVLGVSGEITPGNGSNGSGTSSIGALSFENINITLSGSAKLTFDIGGSGPGLFDTIALAGTGGVFNLGSSSILDIRSVNGATPTGSYLILSANSLSGNFSSLLYNGAAVTDEYTITYLTGGVQLDFGVIPEPSVGLLLLSGLGILVFLRRRRTA